MSQRCCSCEQKAGRRGSGVYGACSELLGGSLGTRTIASPLAVARRTQAVLGRRRGAARAAGRAAGPGRRVSRHLVGPLGCGKSATLKVFAATAARSGFPSRRSRVLAPRRAGLQVHRDTVVVSDCRGRAPEVWRRKKRRAYGECLFQTCNDSSLDAFFVQTCTWWQKALRARFHSFVVLPYRRVDW